MQFFKGVVAEAGADMTDIAPSIPFPQRERQRAKERARSLWRREPGDHYFLTFRRLDLQPAIRARARQVFAVGALRYDAFETVALGFLEKLRAKGRPVAAERDQLMFWQDGFKPLLALG